MTSIHNNILFFEDMEDKLFLEDLEDKLFLEDIAAYMNEIEYLDNLIRIILEDNHD